MTYQKKYGIAICKRAYRALELSGFARIDLRLDGKGHVWVLEANPNPQIAKGEDFAASAETLGISDESLLHRIVNLGMRWQPESMTGRSRQALRSAASRSSGACS